MANARVQCTLHAPPTHRRNRVFVTAFVGTFWPGASDTKPAVCRPHTGRCYIVGAAWARCSGMFEQCTEPFDDYIRFGGLKKF